MIEFARQEQVETTFSKRDSLDAVHFTIQQVQSLVSYD